MHAHLVDVESLENTCNMLHICPCVQVMHEYFDGENGELGNVGGNAWSLRRGWSKASAICDLAAAPPALRAIGHRSKQRPDVIPGPSDGGNALHGP